MDSAVIESGDHGVQVVEHGGLVGYMVIVWLM